MLVRFGQLLRELARLDDVAMRLGGEEFCVVLPRTNRTGALAAADQGLYAAKAAGSDRVFHAVD